MLKENRTVWTHNGQEILIRKHMDSYQVPGASFKLEDLITLDRAIREALDEALPAIPMPVDKEAP